MAGVGKAVSSTEKSGNPRTQKWAFKKNFRLIAIQKNMQCKKDIETHQESVSLMIIVIARACDCHVPVTIPSAVWMMSLSSSDKAAKGFLFKEERAGARGGSAACPRWSHPQMSVCLCARHFM